MMIYNRFLQLFIFLLMTGSMYAESEQCLVVFLKSGAQITLPVSDEPKITFDGSVMSVGNGDYQIENVRKWMVGDPETLSVENAMVKGNMEYRDGVLTVGNASDIHVYNAAGMELSVSVKAHGAGIRTVDFSTLPAGVYVVKAGKETLKIRTR